MCGACGTHGPVSTSTMELNRDNSKAAVAALINQSIGVAGSARPFGDRWTWRQPTGAVKVFDDIEHLVAHLLHSGLLTALGDGDDRGAARQLRRVVQRVQETPRENQ